MSATDYLRERFPLLGEKLPRLGLATLPTPLRQTDVQVDSVKGLLAVKYDNLTGSIYGGNKVRKLEYIFPRAAEKKCERVATFGAVGSNHALATALYAREAGFESTCFLSHQAKTPLVAATLNMHLRNGTELVRFGGSYRSRIQTLRDNLWGRHAWVIPMGGSSWLGTVGFVAAGLELASQIASGDAPAPDRLYVGTGTMGTAVGIGLGLAIAGLDTEVQAVRVSVTSITNEKALRLLTKKTAAMMRRIDESVPEDIASRTNIRIRHEFFGPGYAQGTPQTAEAIEFARDQLGIRCETTYTGKALAALLNDLREPGATDLNLLYWHTYNSVEFDVPADKPIDEGVLPAEFLRYFSS